MTHTKRFRFSNNVSLVTWDDLSLDLIVSFKSRGGFRGSVYKYTGVTEDDAWGLINSNKPGVYLNGTIIPKYTHIKL